MHVLVTGGAGYIGSHATQHLLDRGWSVTAVDNLSRGHRRPMSEIAQRARPGTFAFHECDVTDREALLRVFAARRVDAVLHFAGKAYVGESVDQPLAYAWHNIAGSIALLQAMAEVGVHRLVFSSTCATYGEPEPARIPIVEECPQHPVNPYGRSKLAVEQLLADELVAATRAGRPFAYAALRYFNVAGCDHEGRLGEDHRPETHLVPIALEVALGQRQSLVIHGADYPTPDGTCIRDYVHVDDLVEAHVLALAALRTGESRVWNVGTGRGHSVRQVIDSVQRVTGRTLATSIGPRRAGDPPALYADASRIAGELGWTPRHADLDAIVDSAWRWRSRHPHGYADAGTG